MGLIFNKRLDLTREEILFALNESLTIASAATMLGVSYPTFLKYAKKFTVNEDGTGESILDKFKREKPIKKVRVRRPNAIYKNVPITQILAGHHPSYSHKKLKQRLIDEAVFEEKCQICGYDQRRLIDYKVPLLLIWKDNDLTNHKIENLELVCFNCFFINYNDIKIQTSRYSMDKLYKIE